MYCYMQSTLDRPKITLAQRFTHVLLVNTSIQSCQHFNSVSHPEEKYTNEKNGATTLLILVVNLCSTSPLQNIVTAHPLNSSLPALLFLQSTSPKTVQRFIVPIIHYVSTPGFDLENTGILGRSFSSTGELSSWLAVLFHSFWGGVLIFPVPCTPRVPSRQ